MHRVENRAIRTMRRVPNDATLGRDYGILQDFLGNDDNGGLLRPGPGDRLGARA